MSRLTWLEIKYTFVCNFHQFRTMPWCRWGLRFAILSQTILPLFVSAPLHPPVITRFSNIITCTSFEKNLWHWTPKKAVTHVFFTGSRLGIIEALDLVNYWKCWVRQHPDSNPDKTQKMWQLNPRFPLPLNYSPSRKGRGIFRCFVRKILAYQLSAYKFYMDQNSQMRLF